MGTAKRKVVALLFALVAAAAFVFAFVFEGGERVSAEDSRHDVVSTVKSISPGVTETEYYTNNEASNDQTVVYAVTVDLSVNTVIAGYGKYDASGDWSLTTVREQAAAAESARSVNVVAAVNGDFFNMGTGEPTGMLVMNGIRVKDDATTQARTWFAIDADNKAHIGTGELPENTVEAIGGALVLIRDGAINLGEDDSYYVTKQPRTAVGITAAGDVVIVVADGRQSPYSSGYNYMELAEKMLDLGCVDAINLDGGGSTTYLAQYAGTDELTLANSPSDGREREVSSTLMVVSNSEATGEFGSASVSPVNQIYTPGSTVEFTAIGADTAGFPMDIPETAEWRVAEDCADMGTVQDAAFADGTAAVTFVAAQDAVGSVTIELVDGETVIGSAKIELRWPDTLTMSNSRFSLNFGERTDFGLTAYWETRVVNLKAGDLAWEIGDTGNEEFPILGVMEGDIFVADDKATNVTANVTARLAHDESILASAEVSVGVLPYVVWDFEDQTDPETGEVTMTAEEYYFGGDNPRFAVTTSKTGIGASGQIVDATTGEVRVGQKALQINYDFTQTSPTAGVYFGTTQPMQIPSLGMPTAWGVWIYVPVDDFTFWLRTWFQGYDSEGNKITGNSFSGGFGGNFTEEGGGVQLNQGWNYIYADFTEANSYGAAYYEFSSMAFRIMWVANTSGSATSGYIYLDNFQFEYGANTDDKYAPEIQSVNFDNAAGETVAEDGSTVVSNDPFSLYVSYNEFMGVDDDILEGIEDENLREDLENAPLYATGVNPDNVHVYIDGNEIGLVEATETELWTEEIRLPNGKHRITVEIYDQFLNVATKTYMITVGNESGYGAAYLEGEGDAAYLGSDYLLSLTSDLPAEVQKVTFELRLASGFSLEEGDEVAGFTVTQCALTHVNNNIYTVTVERAAGDLAEGSDVIANFKIPCEATLPEGSVLTYSVQSSEITYTEGTQTDVVNSFYAEGELEVVAYYIIEADTMVVGSSGGYIYVTDADGNPAEGVTVTLDGVPLGTLTDKDGKVWTDAFVGGACNKVVAAYKEGTGYSYGLRVYGVLPGGAEDASPAYVRSVATGNGNTQQRIVWMANPLYAKEVASVRYATRAAYDANGESAFITVSGNNVFVEFTGAYAVFVNQVLLEGLEENTQYVYQAGDGETWSELKTFTTAKSGAETNFFIIGDTQEDNPDAILAYGDTIANSGIDYDFAIQTGDFVDNGSRYDLWANILSLFSEKFSGTDFVQVFGNHEYEGNDGYYPAAMNFVPGKDYYSVTYGNVYVAAINIYSESGLQEAFEWIKQDAAESDAIWKVLTMHRPPYFTNPSGGSDTAHEMVPAFVDEVGFDVVFSGHDHSFARTQPMTGGQVDEENGAVYYIVGAAEAGRYGVSDNPEFNFVKATGEFNALYTSVKATDTQMVITVYNLKADGTGFEVFDTYTISNSCATTGHDYMYVDGYLVCRTCGYSVLPSEIGFSGLIQDKDGRNVYYTNGQPQENQWVNVGDNLYYFGEDGFAADGKVENVDNGYGDLFWFEFDNGKVIGGQTGWAADNTRYFVDGLAFQGFKTIDGTIYYFMEPYSANATGDTDNVGRIARGATRIRANNTIYTIHFNEDGSYYHGDFHETWDSENQTNDSNNWVYTRVREPSDPTASWIAYCYNGWVEAIGYGTYYALPNSRLVSGDYVIDGVKYRFGELWGDPRETDNCKLLGRYYDVTFVSEGTTVSTAEVFQNETVAAPAAPGKTGNSVASFTFAGWFAGDVQYTEDLAVTQEMTFTARYTPVYTEKYNDMAAALAALEVAVTPAEKHEALDAATEIYETMTETEIADAESMGMSFDLYEEMLGKLYTVTFANGETVLSTVVVYEGETVTAPETPAVPAGNSIKSYTFAGWFADDLQYAETLAIAGNTAFDATFNTVYTEKYNDMAAALAALEGADMTPAEKHAALDAATAVYETLTETELADAVAEGMNFGLYEEMFGKLYTVTFANGETVLSTVVVYEGETVTAPETPAVPAGNSIKSYTFAGWFAGDLQYAETLAITGNAAFAATFNTDYTAEYTAMQSALVALAEVGADGSLEDRYEALSAVYALMADFSETEVADAEDEGLSFELYEQMLADYNATADGAAEDMETAMTVAEKFLAVAAAAALLAAAAWMVFFRR